MSVVQPKESTSTSNNITRGTQFWNHLALFGKNAGAGTQFKANGRGGPVGPPCARRPHHQPEPVHQCAVLLARGRLGAQARRHGERPRVAAPVNSSRRYGHDSDGDSEDIDNSSDSDIDDGY